MFPIFHIGPLAIQAPGLILIISLWLGISLAEHFAARRNISPEALTGLVLSLLMAAILGARMTYIARYPSAFMENPASIVSLNPALLDTFGGFAFAFIVALLYGRRNKMPMLGTLDALVPLFAMLAIGLGLSHLASGAAFGLQTTLPWGIDLWGAKRHPSQVYEIIAGLIALVLILPELSKPSIPGILFLKFVAFTSGWLLFLEAFRGDSKLIAGNIRVLQVIAWSILATAMITIDKLKRKSNE
jgi:phosphatidylglycerol:prolipoprotein diacylglycerol transferase